MKSLRSKLAIAIDTLSNRATMGRMKFDMLPVSCATQQFASEPLEILQGYFESEPGFETCNGRCVHHHTALTASMYAHRKRHSSSTSEIFQIPQTWQGAVGARPHSALVSVKHRLQAAAGRCEALPCTMHRSTTLTERAITTPW